MTDKALLHRQVHPSFVINNIVSAQVFENEPSIASSVFNPTPKDNNKLSVYNGEKYEAEQSYNHYAQTFQSKGVVSVSVEECKSIELDCVEDNVPFDGHTYIIGRFKKKMANNLILSQALTFVIGAFAIVLALHMQNVLELMLYSYAFMISGLFVPVLAMLFIKNPSPAAALVAMIGGGTTTLILILMQKLNGLKLLYDLDANLFGISVSILLFCVVHFSVSKKVK